MTEFKEGDRVTFNAVITAEVRRGSDKTVDGKMTVRKIAISMPDGDPVVFWVIGEGRYLEAHVKPEAVELVAPEHWPPMQGDVWEANGRGWHIICAHSGRVLLAIPDSNLAPDGHPLPTYQANLPGDWDRLKALRPVLKYRPEAGK